MQLRLNAPHLFTPPFTSIHFHADTVSAPSRAITLVLFSTLGYGGNREKFHPSNVLGFQPQTVFITGRLRITWTSITPSLATIIQVDDGTQAFLE
jgi:hypothetical protein